MKSTTGKFILQFAPIVSVKVKVQQKGAKNTAPVIDKKSQLRAKRGQHQ
jgi:hypothetical protein